MFPSPTFTERCRSYVRTMLHDAAGEPSLCQNLELREVGPTACAYLCVRWRCHPKLPDPDEIERAILGLLYLRGWTRAVQIIRHLKDQCSQDTTYRRLEKLTGLGIIRRSEDGAKGYDLDPWFRTQAEVNPVWSA